jgi:LysM repeat protein
MKIHISLLVLLLGGIVSNRALAQDTSPTTPIVPIPNQGAAKESTGAAPVETAPETAPEPVAPVVAAPVAPEGPQIYVIKPGDNPWTIAKNHGITLEELLAANTIKDPKNLRIGDVLTLPSATAAPAKPAPAAAPVEPAPEPTLDAPGPGDDWEVYTIKKGDNPWNIAQRLKLDHQKIIALNQGVDFGDLKIGQQIRIPKKG